jgi:predicted Zn-dependent protease with MMP-like domain
LTAILPRMHGTGLAPRKPICNAVSVEVTQTAQATNLIASFIRFETNEAVGAYEGRALWKGEDCHIGPAQHGVYRSSLVSEITLNKDEILLTKIAIVL